jgi:hypothetical protein
VGETVWGNQRVGERAIVVQDEPGAHGGAMVLLLDTDIPDRVRIPEQVPHPDAGRELRVETVVRGPCPACREEPHEIRILVLAGSELLVGMCPRAGWCVHAYGDRP